MATSHALVGACRCAGALHAMLFARSTAKGNANHQRYDAAGHVVASYAADANLSTGYGVTSYVVNAFGDVKVKIDGSGVQTVYLYDNMGRQTKSTSSSVAFYTVSDLNYRGTASLAGSAQLITTYTYDELGRRINEVTGNHDANVTRYDLRGNIVSTTDSNGVVSRTEFDAMNRRVTSIDGNGNNRSWKYGTDSNAADFNRIQSVTNLSDVANGVTIGTVTANSYNQRGQITDEVNASTGKNIHTDYNDAGQITRINDLGTSTQTTYVYDDAGNRIHETITQQRDGNTLVLQDNYLGYDQLNRLRIIQDGHYFIEQDYDKNNNRTHVRSHYYGSKGLDNDVAIDQDLYSTYDAMNRQVLVDVNKDEAAVFDSRTGELSSGNLNIGNGHQFSYDGAGRRLTDTSIAKKIESETNIRGVVSYKLSENTILSTETYQYDAAGRLTGTLRDGTQTDLRYYDVRGNLVQSGMPGNMLGNDSFKQTLETLKLNNTTSLYQYENNGASTRLTIQQTISSPETSEEKRGYTGSATHYDAAGNITHITRDTTSVISYTYKHLDDYHIASVSNQRKKDGVTVTTTNRLDANGHLIETTDDAVGLDNHNRKLYVDTQGNILKKVQSNVTTRSLLVNGEIVGSRSNDGDVADDINQSYQSLRESGSSAFVFKVPAGGTSLGNIAKMVWGDSSLWYKIAEANGLPDGANVPENTLLNIPAREAANRNNTDTTKPYNSAKAIGDLTPVLPMPQGQDGCGPVGTIVTLAVAVALMIYNPPAGSALMKVAIAAANAAVASAAGQAAAVEAGEQERINWRSVAMSGLSGGIGAGLSIAGPLSGSGFGNVVARAAVSNALSQGIGVVTGLQKEPFRWKGVAAAAAGSAVSFVVGDALGKSTFNEALGDRMGGIARGTISGFAGGMTTAIARGGRVSAMQVFVDSFGNSIGQSYAESRAEEQEKEKREDIRALRSLMSSKGVGVRFSDKALSAWSNNIDQGIAAAAQSMSGLSFASAVSETAESNSDWSDLDDVRGPNENRRPRPPRPEVSSLRTIGPKNSYLYAQSTRDNPMGLNEQDRLAVAKYVAGGMFTNRGSANDFTPDMLDQMEFLLKAKTQGVNTDSTNGVGLVASNGIAVESTAARMDREARAPGANRVEKQMEPIMQPITTMVIPGGRLMMAAAGSYNVGYGSAQIVNGDFADGALTWVEGMVEIAGSRVPISKVGLGERLFAAEPIGVNNALPSAATFEGTLYRAVGKGHDPLLIHSGNVSTSHRYTGSGQGGLYFATSEHVVEAEFINNGSSLAGKQMNAFPKTSVSNLLDLSNPAVRDNLGVSLSDLTRTGGTQAWRYEVTQPLGLWAQQNGYRGIIAPSAQADGGVNLILFSAKGVKK